MRRSVSRPFPRSALLSKWSRCATLLAASGLGGCATLPPVGLSSTERTHAGDEATVIAPVFVPTEEAARLARAEARARAEAAGAKSAGQPTDATLARAVEIALLRDPVVPAEAIDVRVESGIVSLEGATGNLLTKDRAVTLARYVPGVRAVADRLEVAAADRPDLDIKGDVEHALVVDPATEGYEIDPQVAEGEVTLRGTVGSETEKALASTVSSGVAGVRQVRNELVVSASPTRDDMEIGADIRGRLAVDPLVDASRLGVRVTEGRAELRGVVATPAERARVVWDAWVAGVHDVDATGLEVEPRPMEAPPAAAEVASPRIAPVRTGGTATSALEIAVEDALRRDPYLRNDDVTVEAHGGLVTLRGTVPSDFERRHAEDLAARIAGVRAVSNRIALGPAPEGADDQTLEDGVENALRWSPLLSRQPVHAEVHGGVVTLEGSVDSVRAQKEAVRVAREAGALRVRSELFVRGRSRRAYP